MAHTHIAIIAGGNLDPSKRLLPRIQSYPYLVAVNGGCNHCHRLGLTPHLIVGDLDSAASDVLEAFNGVPRKTFSPDKDNSDVEEALCEIYHDGCEEITLFGAAGNRLDHTLFNFILLTRYPGILYLETEEELLFVIKKREELDCFAGQNISLIPLNGPVIGVTTYGLNWELDHATLSKEMMSLSNQAVGEKVIVQVEKGDLLCIAQIHK